MYAGMPASRSPVRWSPPSSTNQASPPSGAATATATNSTATARSAPRGAGEAERAEDDRGDQRRLHHDQEEAEAGRRGQRGQVEGDRPEPDGREDREQRDHPADEHGDPGPAGHQRQRREHRQHDPEPPRRAEVVEPAQPQVDAVRGRRRQQPAVEQQPLARAVQQRREPPRREQHRDHGQRDDRRAPGRPVPADAGQQREREQHHDHADQRGDQPGQRRAAADQREQQPGAPGRAPAPVRLRVGEAERGVRRARAAARPTAPEPGGPGPRRRRRPAPAAYVVAPHRISQRFAPAGVASRPATRRNRHAPQSENGTASTSSADTAAAGLAPRTVASSAIGSTYGGAGTAVPSPSSCHEERCSDHQSLQWSGAGESPGPETWPERGAGADEHREHRDGEQHRDRVGEEAGDQPGVLDHLLVLEPLALRRAPRRERRRVALGGRRAAPLGDVGGGLGERGREVADRVEAVPVGQPARRQQPLGGRRGRRSAAARRARRAASSSPGCATTETYAARSSSAWPGERIARKPSIRTNVPNASRTACSGQTRDRELASSVNSAARRSW